MGDAARKRQFAKHRAWVIRLVCMALSVSMQRFIGQRWIQAGIIFSFIDMGVTEWLYKVNYIQILILAFNISVVIQLAMAEFLIQYELWLKKPSAPKKKGCLQRTANA